MKLFRAVTGTVTSPASLPATIARFMQDSCESSRNPLPQFSRSYQPIGTLARMHAQTTAGGSAAMANGCRKDARPATLRDAALRLTRQAGSVCACSKQPMEKSCVMFCEHTPGHTSRGRGRSTLTLVPSGTQSTTSHIRGIHTPRKTSRWARARASLLGILEANTMTIRQTAAASMTWPLSR